MIFRRRKIKPDVQGFYHELAASVGVQDYTGADVARDFRRVFLGEDDAGKRVLHTLLTWCGHYAVSDPDDPEGRIPPADPNELARWAGKFEVGGMIKAALYADLTPLEKEPTDD